jgi:hypothetical protein
MKSDIFNLKRFLRLVQADLVLNKGWIFLGTTVFFCVMTVGSLYPGFLTGPRPSAPDFFLFVLFLSGLVLASLSFSELASRGKTHAFLQLPCSTFEKYLSRYFLTSWVYVLAGLIVYSVFIFLARFALSVFHEPMIASPRFYNFYRSVFHGQMDAYTRFFHFYDHEIAVTIFYYLIFHAVSFMGAAYYKRQVFLKTTAVFLVSYLSLIYFQKLLIRILYQNIVFHPEPFLDIPILDPIWRYSRGSMFFVSLLTQWPSPFLSVMFLIIGYLRLKEREAVDGV